MIISCKTLGILNISDLSIGNLGIKLLSETTNELLSLNISKSNLSATCIPYLSSLVWKSSQLHILKLSGNKFGDKSLIMLSEMLIRDSSKITKLDLGMNDLTGAGMRVFFNSFPVKSIESLNLDGN